MILLFLGSWRSTLIITVSIPLAILASVTTLSLLGETINVMTLGGLALAVGILVDDATVTIENINWHLEQGKEIETAILDGAQQIVVPATVSLLCICIAFVPMFGLGGVAGYLFRPLAEAVVFALIASYVLSRTLVPTLANYLLRKQARAAHSVTTPTALRRLFRPSPSPQSPDAIPAGLRARASKPSAAPIAVCSHLCLHNRAKLIAGFMGFTLLSFALGALSGPGLLPERRWRADQDPCPGADRHADRRDHQARRSDRRGRSQDHPGRVSWAASSTISASASAASTWPTTTRGRSASRMPTS